MVALPEWLVPVLLAVAVSLDGLAVGAAYGLRKIRIPRGSLAIIGAVSALLAAVSTVAGANLGEWLPVGLASRLGALILLGLGLSLIWQSVSRRPGGAARRAPPSETGPLLLVRIRFLGLMVQIWRDPGAADMDRSGRLEGNEAAALGLSLGLDAVAAGLGMALNGGGYVFPALVGPVQVGMVLLGARLTGRLRGTSAETVGLASGSILLTVALFRLI